MKISAIFAIAFLSVASKAGGSSQVPEVDLISSLRGAVIELYRIESGQLNDAGCNEYGLRSPINNRRSEIKAGVVLWLGKGLLTVRSEVFRELGKLSYLPNLALSEEFKRCSGEDDYYHAVSLFRVSVGLAYPHSVCLIEIPDYFFEVPSEYRFGKQQLISSFDGAVALHGHHGEGSYYDLEKILSAAEFPEREQLIKACLDPNW